MGNTNKLYKRTLFEMTALRITGTSFYILAGLIISLISIATMWLLIRTKRDVGERLNSAPILADANCTLVCLYMSVILLVSSAIYTLTGFGFVDSLGAIGVIYFSYKEGKESFEKARGGALKSCWYYRFFPHPDLRYAQVVPLPKRERGQRGWGIIQQPLRAPARVIDCSCDD